MKFGRIKKRRKPNKSKLIILLIILLGLLYFWQNAESLMEKYF